MVRITLRLPDELHEKLRWLSYQDQKSQQVIVIEILEKELVDVEVPTGRRRA